MFGRLFGWLVDWLTGRLVDWSTGRQVGWLTGRLVDWSPLPLDAVALRLNDAPASSVHAGAEGLVEGVRNAAELAAAAGASLYSERTGVYISG